MLKAPLGHNGPLLPRLGYGAMVLEGFYGVAEEGPAIQTLSHAMDRGLMIDTADAYGEGHNERLIAKSLTGRTDKPFLASKFGLTFDNQVNCRQVPTGWGFSLNVNASPAYASRALDDSLQRLGVDFFDLWYLHYPDPEVEIEETLSAMGKAVQAGKVRYLGLSNVTAEQVRRAHAVHPVSAVQYEYSLWRREAETQLLPTLRELGIALVAWSPLGSGFLTGKLDKLEAQDFRLFNPKLSNENFAVNKTCIEKIAGIADNLNLSTAQLALAWLLHQGEDIFPIPGTRKPARIDENLLAASIDLDPMTLAEIDRLTAPGNFVGGTLLD